MHNDPDHNGERNNPAASVTRFTQEVSRQFELLLARLDRQDIMLEELVKQFGGNSFNTSCDGKPRSHHALSPLSDGLLPLQDSNEAEGALAQTDKFSSFDTRPPPSIDHEGDPKPALSQGFSNATASERDATWMQQLTRSTPFALFFGFLIVLNAIYIGVELEQHIKPPTIKNASGQTLVTHLFSLAFLIELATRIVAEKTRFLTNRKDVWWNLFDLTLVTVSTADFVFFSVTNLKELEVNLRLLRIVRTIRFLRLLRMARVLRAVRALRVLVHSIMTTLKSLIWAMFLLTIIMYFFAILFTNATHEHLFEIDGCFGPACAGTEGDLWRMFGTIPRSMFMLFKSLTNGVDWGVCTQALAEIDGSEGFCVAAFVSFISFCYFAVLNVVTGVFCQKAIESAHRDREMAISTLMENKEAHVTNIKAQFAKMFKQIDADKSGLVTLEEFQTHMDDDSVSAFFILLDVDPSEAYALFKLLDDDGSGSIDADEFVDGCLRLQGQAKSIDLAKIRHEHRNMFKLIHKSNLTQWSRTCELMYRHERLLARLTTKIEDVIATPMNPMPSCPKDVSLMTCPNTEASDEYAAQVENIPKPHQSPTIEPPIVKVEHCA